MTETHKQSDRDTDRHRDRNTETGSGDRETDRQRDRHTVKDSSHRDNKTILYHTRINVDAPQLRQLFYISVPGDKTQQHSDNTANGDTNNYGNINYTFKERNEQTEMSV